MQSAIHTLRKQGYRITKPRVSVLKALTKRPQTVRSLLTFLQESGNQINRVTLYRILAQLVQIGIISKTQQLGKPVAFEFANQSHHHHIVCQECGDMQDFSIPEKTLIPTVAHQTGFQITNHIVEFTGVCGQCQ